MQNVPLRVRRVPDPVPWEACRAAEGDTVVFHRWDWLQLMARALGSHFLPLGVYRSDALVGLTPLLVKQYGPYKNANWVPFPYLGPIVPGTLLAEALTALDAYQRRNGIGLIQLGFAPGGVVDTVTLAQHGYTTHQDTTFVVSRAGRGKDAVWVGMQSRGRASVRRAQRAKVVVQAATAREVAHELPAIMREVFTARRQAPPYPPAAAGLVWEQYHDSSDARMAVAHYNGDTAAILITMMDGDHATMWDGGGRRHYRSVNPNALLYWDAIRWAYQRSCRAIDLLGNPDEGIATFKESFGGVEKPYVVAHRTNSQLARWGLQVHHRASLLRGLARKG